MFIKLTAQKNDRTSVRIMESFWENNKARQRTILSLGSAKTKKELLALKKKAQELIIQMDKERNPVFPGMEEAFYEPVSSPALPRPLRREQRGQKKSKGIPLLTDTLEQQRIIQGIDGVCGVVYDQVGFNTIIQETYKDRQWNEYLKACVLSRVSQPQSKRGTVKTLERDYNQKIPLSGMYRMMDRLYRNIGRVKALVAQNTLSLFGQELDVLFFDVTTLYFESFTPDELRKSGFSKDNKVKETQVVLALVTNSEGHPISYELFPGNTSEGQTLVSAVKKLKSDFNVRSVALVADRAMFSEKNLKFMEEAGFQYVVAARLKSLDRQRKEWILSEKQGLKRKSSRSKGGRERKERKERKESEFESVMEWEDKQRRWVVSYSPKRAKKDQLDRQRLIDRLLKRIKKGQISVKSLMSNSGTKRYIKLNKKAKAELDTEKIKAEESWDGLHGVVTNIRGEKARRLLDRYRGLWKIEEAFRVNKHTLKMRPIYHWTRRRIHAHVAICFLAYCLSYLIKYRLEKAGMKFSIEKMREVLKRDQYSIIEDQTTGKRYRYPSKFTEPIKAIYEAFGLKRVSEITPLD